MKQIVTGNEIKEIEKYVIGRIGIPSLVLMERAALSISEKILMQFTVRDKICVVCGSGNNGADGLAIARQLLEHKRNVCVVIVGDSGKFSAEMKVQLEILHQLGVTAKESIPAEPFDCFVDAIFGVGLTREITDKRIIKAIETMNLSDAYIYSVDVPTGIHADLGKVMGCAVKANETVTFSANKVGLCLYPGKTYAGKVYVKNIGIDVMCNEDIKIGHYTLEKEDCVRMLERNENGNKGTFGKVLVIAGNEQISGACVLCAKAVLKSGAGMVKVLSEDKTLDVIRNVLPEAMTGSLDDAVTMKQEIAAAICWADSVVIGPGLGTDEKAYKKLKYVLTDFPTDKVLVLDADAINLISQNDELNELTKKVNKAIYTPHMMELARLLHMQVDSLPEKLDEIMKQITEESKAVYVCKDSVTRCYYSKMPVYINCIGNSGMATAGSGDVLAGIIGALTARKGTDIFEGVTASVFLHSLAGDEAAYKYGKNSMTAEDIINSLPDILKKMEDVS